MNIMQEEIRLVNKLNDLLENSTKYELLENEFGDKLLKIENYYNSNEKIYINFYELSLFLKNYMGTKGVLLENIEEE